MRDEQTGSWWQQITGEAIQGPLKDQKLVAVDTDEVSFGIWKRENPEGRVLSPDEKTLADDMYESADWESKVGRMPVKVDAKMDNALEPRTLIVGIVVADTAKAYPFSSIEKQNPIIDTVGGQDIVIFLGEDKRSVRAFNRNLAGRKLEFLRTPGSSSVIMDAETGSTWDFSGLAVNGELAGKQLSKIAALKDYWFDWKTYHPETRLYALGPK